MKIVTLIPSATEIVSFLGQKKSIIGRSHECDFPHDLSKIKTLTEPKINVDGTSGEIIGYPWGNQTNNKSQIRNTLSEHNPPITLSACRRGSGTRGCPLAGIMGD